MLLAHIQPLLHCSNSSSSSCSTLVQAPCCRPFQQLSRESNAHICFAAGKRPGRRSSRQPVDDGLPAKGSLLARTINSELRSAESLPELADIVNEWGGSFDPIHTATAFYMTGRLAQRQPAAAQPLLDNLAGIWDQLIPSAGSQALANVLWACGKLRYTNPQLWGRTVQAFLDLMQHGPQDEIDSQHVSNVLLGMAYAALASKGDVPGMTAAETQAAVSQLAESMWVIATQPFGKRTVPQDVSNTLWACAKLRVNPGDKVLNSLLQIMARQSMLDAADSQHVSNTLWAVSELRQECSWQPQVEQRVWQRLLGEQLIQRITDRGTPQNVSNTLLALAWLATPTASATAAPAVMPELARQCAEQLLQGKVAQQVERYSPQEVSNSMWACAKLGYMDAPLFQRAVAAAPAWLPEANRANVTQVAWACKTLNFKQQHLLAELLQRSNQLVQEEQQRYQRQKNVKNSLKISLGVAHAVAVLDMQQLAGDMRALLAASGVDPSSKLGPLSGMVWEIHSWLVQHQLLDGQGLAGVLSQQQLDEGRCTVEQQKKLLMHRS